MCALSSQGWWAPPWASLAYDYNAVDCPWATAVLHRDRLCRVLVMSPCGASCCSAIPTTMANLPHWHNPIRLRLWQICHSEEAGAVTEEGFLLAPQQLAATDAGMWCAKCSCQLHCGSGRHAQQVLSTAGGDGVPTCVGSNGSSSNAFGVQPG